jgi:hypothetical protein
MKNNPLMTPLIVLILSVTFAQTPLFAEIYQWTDKNGTVHFSDNPPNAINGNPSTVRRDDINNSPSQPKQKPSTGLATERKEYPPNKILPATATEADLKDKPPTGQGRFTKIIGPIMVLGAGLFMIWISLTSYTLLVFPILSNTSLWRNSKEDKESFELKVRIIVFVIGLSVLIWQLGAILGFWAEGPVKFIY